MSEGIAQEKTNEEAKEDYSKYCGIVMPISPCKLGEFEYKKEFLTDIRTLVEDAIKDAGLVPHVVWENDKSNQIKHNIINNIRNFKYCVCVICGLNPNVMLELGLAIAFDKHVVIVTDSASKYPFDVADTTCIDFPLSQGYIELNQVKTEITTMLEKLKHKNAQTFLSHFGNIKPADNMNPLNQVDIAETLSLLKNQIGQIAICIEENKQSEPMSLSPKPPIPLTDRRNPKELYERASKLMIISSNCLCLHDKNVMKTQLQAIKAEYEVLVKYYIFIPDRENYDDIRKILKNIETIISEIKIRIKKLIAQG